MNADSVGSPSRVLTGLAMLTGLAIVGAVAAILTEQQTRDRIAEKQRTHILRVLHELVTPESYDNDLLADAITVISEELLGTARPVTVYRASINGEFVAAIVGSVAPDGYGGPIRLLVGIDRNGVLTGVRVAHHQETPNLGAEISQDRSDWILGFDGRSLDNPPASGWSVRRDGGTFDQFTGATISPRATVKAVHRALIYFSDNRDEVFAVAPGAAE